MRCAIYELTDRGYASPIDGMPAPLPEIWGLSNQNEEKFGHLGVTGYPTSHVWMVEGDSKVLALFDGPPDSNGVEVAETDVLTKLINEYGFPPETTLDETGKPIVLTEA